MAPSSSGRAHSRNGTVPEQLAYPSLPASFRDSPSSPVPIIQDLETELQVPKESELVQQTTLTNLIYSIEGFYKPALDRFYSRLIEVCREDNSSTTLFESINSSSSSLPATDPAEWELGSPLGLMLHILNTVGHMLICLQTTCLEPELYKQLMFSIAPCMETLDKCFDVVTDKDRLVDWYELVQMIDLPIPRLYLMMHTFDHSLCGIDMENHQQLDFMIELDDLNQMLKQSQHPLKTIFVRHYFAHRIMRSISRQKDNLPDLRRPVLMILLDNFLQMNIHWVRHQWTGPLDHRNKRYRERHYLTPLLLEALDHIVSIASHEHFNENSMLKSVVLPLIIKHSIMSNDPEDQLLLFYGLVDRMDNGQILFCLPDLMQMIGSFDAQVDLQSLLQTLIDRGMSGHGTNQSNDFETVFSLDTQAYWASLISLLEHRQCIDLMTVLQLTLTLATQSADNHYLDKMLGSLANLLSSHPALESPQGDRLNETPTGQELEKLLDLDWSYATTSNSQLEGLYALLRWLPFKQRFNKTLLFLTEKEEIEIDLKMGLIETLLCDESETMPMLDTLVNDLLVSCNLITSTWNRLNQTNQNSSTLVNALKEKLLRLILSESQNDPDKCLEHIRTFHTVTGVFSPSFYQLAIDQCIYQATIQLEEAFMWALEFITEVQTHGSAADQRQALLRIITGINQVTTISAVFSGAEKDTVKVELSNDLLPLLDKLLLFIDRLLKKMDRMPLYLALLGILSKFKECEGSRSVLKELFEKIIIRIDKVITSSGGTDQVEMLTFVKMQIRDLIEQTQVESIVVRLKQFIDKHSPVKDKTKTLNEHENGEEHEAQELFSSNKDQDVKILDDLIDSNEAISNTFPSTFMEKDNLTDNIPDHSPTTLSERFYAKLSFYEEDEQNPF